MESSSPCPNQYPRPMVTRSTELDDLFWLILSVWLALQFATVLIVIADFDSASYGSPPRANRGTISNIVERENLSLKLRWPHSRVLAECPLKLLITTRGIFPETSLAIEPMS